MTEGVRGAADHMLMATGAQNIYAVLGSAQRPPQNDYGSIAKVAKIKQPADRKWM